MFWDTKAKFGTSQRCIVRGGFLQSSPSAIDLQTRPWKERTNRSELPVATLHALFFILIARLLYSLILWFMRHKVRQQLVICIEILSKHLTQSQRGEIQTEAQRGEGLNPLLTLSNTLVGNLVVTKFTQPHPLVTIFLADKSLHWKLLLLLPNSMVICLALSFSVSLGTCLCLQNWIQYLPLTTAMEPYANLESHFCRTMHNLTFDSGQIIPTIG